jgi:hypothetical protein
MTERMRSILPVPKDLISDTSMCVCLVYCLLVAGAPPYPSPHHSHQYIHLIRQLHDSIPLSRSLTQQAQASHVRQHVSLGNLQLQTPASAQGFSATPPYPRRPRSLVSFPSAGPSTRPATSSCRWVTSTLIHLVLSQVANSGQDGQRNPLNGGQFSPEYSSIRSGFRGQPASQHVHQFLSLVRNGGLSSWRPPLGLTTSTVILRKT